MPSCERRATEARKDLNKAVKKGAVYNPEIIRNRYAIVQRLLLASEIPPAQIFFALSIHAFIVKERATEHRDFETASAFLSAHENYKKLALKKGTQSVGTPD